MEIKDLWGVAETPLQMERLLKAMRAAALMADSPYYRGNEKGVIYEVTPDGKMVSPLILAIKMGAPAESIRMLLQEEERMVLEWRRAKEAKEKEEPKEAE
jgi:hypothetical protein